MGGIPSNSSPIPGGMGGIPSGGGASIALCIRVTGDGERGFVSSCHSISTGGGLFRGFFDDFLLLAFFAFFDFFDFFDFVGGLFALDFVRFFLGGVCVLGFLCFLSFDVALFILALGIVENRSSFFIK